ncbi:MAG: MATE family efflux transporter [Schwartzia sp.]|nr:MATE family efflux transporter [Schwartzia sp. (in: firmicutes)]
MSNKERLFSWRRLLRLIWPLLVEQLLSVLVGMVDVLMVSFVGESAVSGVSLVDSINHLVLQFLFAMTAGGTVVCAKYIGGGDYASARKSGGQLLSVTTSALLLLSIVMLCGGESILRILFGTVAPEVMRDAEVYMRFTAVSFPFLAVYHSAASIFRAEGNTRLSMMVSLGMNLLNIFGDALCIFGFGMGVEGVAIPTLLSRLAAAVAICVFLQAPENALRIENFRQCRPNGTILREILSIGVPSGVESSLFNVGKVLLQSLVSTLGTASIAAYAVAGNLVTYLYLPGNALGAAMMTIVGQCRGAGEAGQAKYYAKILILLNYAALLPICAAMIFGRSFWVGLYHLSPQSAFLAEGLLVAHSLAMIIWPVAFLLPYYFRAIGRAVLPMAVAISAMAVFRLGFAYLFVDWMGKDVLWIWYAMFLDWAFRLVVFGAAFRKVRPA